MSTFLFTVTLESAEHNLIMTGVNNMTERTSKKIVSFNLSRGLVLLLRQHALTMSDRTGSRISASSLVELSLLKYLKVTNGKQSKLHNT